MTSFVRRFLGPLAALLLLAGITIAQRPTPTPSYNIPFVVPGQQGNRNPIDFYDFSWQEFFALNWPAKVTYGQPPQRGVPDTNKKIGDLGVPRVWETWKADFELFPAQPGYPPKIVKPTDWSSWEVAQPICPAPSGSKMLPLIAKGESTLPGAVNQAMGGPLVDQHKQYVRYEIRVNRTEYDETKDKLWFLRNHLSKDPKKPNLFTASTPGKYGAIELKAAWRIMTKEEAEANPPRFYTSKAYVVDPKTHKCSDQPVTVGLIGFHIGHKTDTFHAWVWSTFEHVDNVPAPGVPAPHGGYSLYDGTTRDTPLKLWGFSPSDAYAPLDVSQLPNPPTQVTNVVRLNPIPSEIQDLNSKVHQLPGIRGTVWEKYELVEAQWQTKFPQPIAISNPKTGEDRYSQLAGFPTDAVANTSMESFFQGFKGDPPDPASNMIGIPTFGTSCLHCHYQAAQTDFSWVLADAPWPSAPGSTFKRKGAAAHK
jgi:hypothetical protein